MCPCVHVRHPRRLYAREAIQVPDLARVSSVQESLHLAPGVAACVHSVSRALQVHGNEAIAQALGLPVRRRGRPPLKSHDH